AGGSAVALALFAEFLHPVDLRIELGELLLARRLEELVHPLLKPLLPIPEQPPALFRRELLELVAELAAQLAAFFGREVSSSFAGQLLAQVLHPGQLRVGSQAPISQAGCSDEEQEDRAYYGGTFVVAESVHAITPVVDSDP